MEYIFETLAPLALLIALGAGLAHIRFLGATFIADLNKLAFWIALPALIFTTANNGSDYGEQMWKLLAVLLSGSLLISLFAWGASYALRMPGQARGTLVQSAFRGNLAYIGIPVLANSFQKWPAADTKQAMTIAVVVVVLTMAFYNIFAVIVLQLSQQGSRKVNVGQMARSIATNPLMMAGLLGLIMPLVNVHLPAFLQQSLQLLGAAAIPLALLCIGGSLVMSPLQGKRASIVAAAALKTALLPVLVYGLARLVGLDPLERHIALVLSACPTAAAAFIMACQMGGDETLASGSIALSTLLSGLSLAVALWL